MSLIDKLVRRSDDVRKDIDLISLLAGLGEISTSAHNNIFGFDHLGLGSNIPLNSDNRGLVFFTRPRMNMSDNNMGLDRVFTRLLTPHDRTYQRALRAILDPIGHKYNFPTPLVDEHNAFIPLLSNNLISLSGWEDPTLNVYSSQEGIEKEAWAMGDDVVGVNRNFTLNATFRNIAGDPITLLIFFWIRYICQVYGGLMMPHLDSIVGNEIDYQTRIYRFVLDPSRQFVQKVAATRASFPTASSIARAFDYTSDRPIIEESSTQISVPFQCSAGADYMDPITFEEFNFITQVYNPNMRDELRNSRMKLLSMREQPFFKNYVYPRVDPITNRFEWWTPIENYNRIMSSELVSQMSVDVEVEGLPKYAPAKVNSTSFQT